MKFLNRPFSMSLMLISLAWFGFSACTGALPEDKDGLHTGAQVLFQGVNIDDKVDQKRGDKADWRKIHAAQRGDMIVTLTMAPGSVNQVTGHLSVYDHTVQPLRDVQIQPGDGRYTITAPVQAGRDYFIRVASDRGASGYRLLVSLRAADPCALCTDDQECVNGACVARAEEDPCGGCSDDRVCDAEIEQCVFPRCVGKRCKRRHFCNRRGRCVPSARCPRGKERVRGRCVAKCRRGERRVRGNCVARPKTVTCGSGERREGNRCVPVAADTKTVKAKIVGGRDGGGGVTIVTLSKGSAHGLRNGMTGRVRGKRATIVSVDRFAAKAKVSLPKNKVVGNRSTVVFVVPIK